MKPKPPKLTLLTFDDFTATEILRDRDSGPAPRASAGPFVLNLRAVAAPFPVPQLRSPGLEQVEFFFTESREGGRPRIWLQLGYFASLAEARQYLDVLRPLYPAAFVTAASVTGRGGGASPAADGP